MMQARSREEIQVIGRARKDGIQRTGAVTRARSEGLLQLVVSAQLRFRHRIALDPVPGQVVAHPDQHSLPHRLHLAVDVP